MQTPVLIFGFSIFLPTMQPPDKCCKTPLVVGVTWVKSEGVKGPGGHANTIAGVQGRLRQVKATDGYGAKLCVL